MSKLSVTPSSYEMSSRMRRFITFDFANDMAEGTTIVSAASRMVHKASGQAVADSVLDGDPVIDGTVVGQWVKEPPVAKTYLLTIEAVMSDGSESDPVLLIEVPY